jgi:hypothetical protein
MRKNLHPKIKRAVMETIGYLHLDKDQKDIYNEAQNVIDEADSEVARLRDLIDESQKHIQWWSYVKKEEQQMIDELCANVGITVYGDRI